MISKLKEMERLRELREKFTTAEDLGKDACIKCGYCCHRRPCVLMPRDLPTIASFLSISVEQLITQYCCIDLYPHGEKVYYVKVAGENQRDLLGRFIPTDRTYNEGKCIFLSADNLCTVYDVRPAIARQNMCWKPPKPKEFVKILQHAWRNGKLCEVYPPFRKMNEEFAKNDYE